ncbi:hypothetical protein PR048_001934 [Dryococelus australis]|uniref:Integrase catalytic domain-containing protein n=1 Tax=Dryococelus australis TaxID=614101 RepID=A0ABQ9IK84_9NEOP|nr:hypothetical protein PR048_001934 [Dryococelus australis]
MGILMWGYWVVVPNSSGGGGEFLARFHGIHVVVVKMKSWPGMDYDIEALTKTCSDCELEKPNPAKYELQNWPSPTGPWQRIRVDFLGPWQGKLYLIAMDVLSKWLEVAEVPSTAAIHAIQVLQSLFACFVLCTHLVSDNGPPFTAVEFLKFLAARGAVHLDPQ